MNHKTDKKDSSARSISIARPALPIHRLPNEETRCRAVGLTAPSQTYGLLFPCYLQARLYAKSVGYRVDRKVLSHLAYAMKRRPRNNIMVISLRSSSGSLGNRLTVAASALWLVYVATVRPFDGDAEFNFFDGER
jgi:hypothetical protein